MKTTLFALLACTFGFAYSGEVKEINRTNLVSFHAVQNPTCTPEAHGYKFRNQAWFYFSFKEGTATRWVGTQVISDSWNSCPEAKRQTAMGLAYKNANFHSIQAGYLSPTEYGCEERYVVATLADPISLPTGEKAESADVVYATKATQCP